MKKAISQKQTENASIKKIFTALIVACGTCTGLQAQVSLTFTNGVGTSYAEDFDDLANSGTTASVMPTGWAFAESGSNADTTYGIGTGSSNAGNTYSFGAADATDRALGGVRSGNLVPIIGANFTNNTGLVIETLAIGYTGEQWRLGATGRNDRLDFEYSTNSSTPFLTTGTYTGFSALSFTAPISTGSTGALNGNAVANRTAISGSLTALSVANAGSVAIRWTDPDVTGADDGLAVDDFTLRATQLATGDTNRSITTIAGAADVIIRNGSTTDSVLTVNNATAQSFSGQLIDGSSGELALTKTAAGILTLTSNANTYTGTTTIEEGTLALTGSGVLGTGNVVIGDLGTLDISGKSGNLTVASVLSGTGSVITGANTLVVSGTFSPGASPGLLEVDGNLSLTNSTIFEIDGLARGTNYDATDITGLLTFGGTLTLDFASAWQAGTYSLFSANSYSSDFSSVLVGGFYSDSLNGSNGIWTGTVDGGNFSFSSLTGDLSVTPVPEPHEYALGLLGLLAIVAYVRRRRQLA